MTKCTVFARITPKTGCLKMKRNFRRTFSCEDNSISITASPLSSIDVALKLDANLAAGHA